MSSRKTLWLWLMGGVFLLAIVVLLFSRKGTASPNTQTLSDPIALPGIVVSTTTPWAPETENLKARLSAIGLPALLEEGSALHMHEHLDIFVHGKAIPVPANIGINSMQNFISPIHVYDTSGIIHVESPTLADFTLGQFFDIWGLRFTVNCVGGYCADETNSLDVFINGEKYAGDPRQIVLAPYQEIVVVYGSLKEAPATIPSSFVFPEGE